ncbi:hypothetical protein ASPU41_16460 [Arthrobacter sp. U41]|nr:hypothetical protein ASPU41_16460 [Arthrobacter sp. U41]
MPLGPRRLVLVGSLCVLAGVLAGRYFVGGLVLATAGAAVLATALSYRVEKPWFSGLSWLVSVTGAVWTTVTAGYWWSIGAAADSSSGPPESAAVLYYLGLTALIIMSSGSLAGIIIRTIGRRRTPDLG